MSDPVLKRLASALSLPPATASRVAALLEAGNTVPFLARYRKEETGGLDEVGLRAFQAELAKGRRLEARREAIRASLEEQGALDAALAARLDACEREAQLEDLYLPYRPKRRTRAALARERGLAPLAAMFERPPAGGGGPLTEAARFVGPEVPDAAAALAGARDILAEQAAEAAPVRARARTLAFKEARFEAARAPKGEDPEGKFRAYYAFSEPVARMQPHRVLACDRGEAEGVLRIAIALPEARIVGFMREGAPGLAGALRAPGWREAAEAALADGFSRLLGPALEREIRAHLTEQAHAHATRLFGANLKALLLQPPLAGKVVMGVDPGYKSGCKVAVVDPTGKPLGPGWVFHLHREAEALSALKREIAARGVDVVAIGNGTASRETEALVARAIAGTPAAYAIVNEAGASVYSASELARAEFPDLDATQRGNISIARRLQDPLAELVKIEPSAIGVGLYQHDLEPKALSEALDGVVEDAVNHVGVDLNTASAPLLARVAGIGPKLAASIVAHREAAGPYPDRAALRKVKGLGPKAFEQAAGFLRVPGGGEPLDATAIHPEAYAATRALLKRLGLDPAEPGLGARVAEARAGLDLPATAAALGLGVPTLADILDALEKPGRDPREASPRPHLRQDVLSLEALAPGMRLTGTVRNVVDFGAFVDVGVKQDGLVHVSELAAGFVRDPLAVVSVGDVVEVVVLEVDVPRKRLALSRKRALAGAP